MVGGQRAPQTLAADYFCRDDDGFESFVDGGEVPAQPPYWEMNARAGVQVLTIQFRLRFVASSTYRG